MAVIIAMAAIGFLISEFNERWSAATHTWAPPTDPAKAIKLRTFADAQGHTAQFSTPLLDKFSYPGDEAVCARFNTLKTALGPDDVLDVGDCSNLSALSPVDKSARLAKLAEQLFTLASANPAQSEDDKDANIVLALSCLKEGLDILPADAAAAASTTLESGWIASQVSDHFPHYDPPFLFGPAFRIETGEARLVLCPLLNKGDCSGYLPAAMIDALTEVGRWRSDDSLLVRAADLLEKKNNSIKDPTTTDQLSFAQDFSSALGYAAEIVSGDRSIAYLRRGVAPLAQWFDANEHHANDYTLSRVLTTLGAQYGRLADRTVDKADAEKALHYDSEAYQLEQKISKSDGWEALANLGDSTLLVAEINHNEAGFKQALQHHRDALQLAEGIGDQRDIIYSKMKLARTLLHYEQAPGLSLSRDDRIAMLNESAKAARDIIPFMEDTGTRVYSDITRSILADAQKGLAELQSNAAKDQPVDCANGTKQDCAAIAP